MRLLPSRRHRLALYVLLLLFIRAHGHILRLRFDGSLQSPRDPGFPPLPTRVATAAASCQVIVDNESTTGNNHVFWLGGKLFPEVDNSAEIEYEGLLLGLEKARELVNYQSIDSLQIQGDCKTVIDQLQQTSLPRKLRDHYERAQGLLGKLSVNVEVRHVPREQNQLSDGLCSIIREEILVKEAQQQILSKLENGNLDEDLSIAFQMITKPNSHIPYSQRPTFYRTLVERIKQAKDRDQLLKVGQHLEQEAKTIWLASNADEKYANQLRTQGIRYQLEGLVGNNKDDPSKRTLKLANALERKHRHRLSKYTTKDDWNCLCRFSIASKMEMELNNPVDQALLEEWLKAAEKCDGWKANQSFWLKIDQRAIKMD